MNTLKRFLVASFLILFISTDSNVVIAGGLEPATAQLINNTITYLEAALKSVDANDLAVAQEHVKAAGQSSKLILGGTIEARKQGGSRAITNARQQLEKGNTAGAAEALREALEGFKSLSQPDKTGNQGGL
jgi:predicted negative regulator of RcsB-dependent stress response